MSDLDAVARRLRSRANTIRGGDAQEIVGQRLRAGGLELVQRVETGWRVQRVRGRITGASPMGKVHCDWSAIVPGTGQSVRCEVKSRKDSQLSLSDFERWQLDALTAHTAFGGLTLIGHVHSRGVAVLRWPLVGLEKGRPLNAYDERWTAALWDGVRP
ncbi:MAG: hypothetical protein V4636_13040 [Pseudomonadota bacterium]